MTTTEALGYLKGLLDGLDLEPNKKETKIFKAMIDVLENLNEDVLDITEEIDAIEEQCDIISDDLSELEDVVYDDDFACEGCAGCSVDDDEDFDDAEEDEEELEGEFYSVCPICKAEFIVEEDVAMDGGIVCPNCGEFLKFVSEDEE